ncbi:MAG: radical SAM protein [Candidatus Aminicenantaceae bacterium]
MDAGFLIRNSLSLLLRRRLNFHFDRIPMQARGISGHKLFNLAKIGLNRLLPIPRTLGYPYMAHISPSGLCDLRCNQCPTAAPETQGKQLLAFDTFKKFIDETGDYLLYIILWSWGEPLLNPEIYRMIAYAKQKNILSVTSSNLNRLSRKDARCLISSGLDALIVALDGTTPETHACQRIGGDFNRVVDNVRLLMEEKRRAGSRHPIVNLRMVVSRENEGEVEAFWQLAQDLGVDMVSIKAFSTRQAGCTNPEIHRRFVPQGDKYRWYRYHPDFTTDKQPKRYKCRFPWTKPTLFANGTVASCEFDLTFEYPFGNINQNSFDEIWFSPQAEDFRRRFQKNRDTVEFCRDCVYDYKLIEGCVLEWEYLTDAVIP